MSHFCLNWPYVRSCEFSGCTPFSWECRVSEFLLLSLLLSLVIKLKPQVVPQKSRQKSGQEHKLLLADSFSVLLGQVAGKSRDEWLSNSPIPFSLGKNLLTGHNEFHIFLRLIFIQNKKSRLTVYRLQEWCQHNFLARLDLFWSIFTHFSCVQ